MGPLQGVKVIEFAGVGPGPFCAMLLSDMGAQVVRIDRKGGRGANKFDVTSRGRRSLALDLKKPEAIEVALRLIAQSDALLEGFRPGVMEKLGLGPDLAQKRNPKLVYGRMTGWGQTGPLAHAAGHDINYIALTGALHAMGRKEHPPSPPLNLVGDFGGGALYLAFGIACALFEARQSGKGQVVDCAMTDGAASLMAMFYGFKAMGMWSDEREANLLDGGAHFYSAYETADNKWVSIGSIEPQFYALLLEKTGIVDPDFQGQMDRAKWPALKAGIARVIKTKTRSEWDRLMEGSDVCYAPVLSLAEAPKHAHNEARATFVEIDGVVQPAPAPRFSRTKPEIQGPGPAAGQHNDQVLAELGFGASERADLRSAGAI